MKRALGVLVVTAVLTLAPAAPAGASLPTSTAGTHVSFSKWVVYVVKGSSLVAHTVPVGGTFTRCASQTLYRLRAFYRATGPSTGPDVEIWDLNGRVRDDFSDRKLGPSGFFGIFNPSKAGLPSGQWSLTIKYGGRKVGQAAVKVTTKRGC